MTLKSLKEVFCLQYILLMIGNFIGNSYKKRFMKSTVCKALKMICLWTLTPSFQGSNPCSAA